jgi:GH24 family phage-related lysozyme (muramidase)
MSMSSYLISHNHSLYVLLTGTGKTMDIRQTVGKTFLKPNYQENVDRLIPFWKEQEGSIKYQTNIKQETTTPVMGGKISSQNPYIKTPSFDEKTQTFKAYYDKIGKKWTIGYGHTDGVEKEDTATINQADAFLEEDGKRLIHLTDNLLKQKYGISISELPEPGQDLVGDMGFNIGPDKFTTEWPNMLNALKNKDWVTVSKEYTATNTPERNKARFEKWIEPRLIAEQSFKSKQFEQQDKKESLKKQKIVYENLPTLIQSIQTKNIPTDQMTDYIGAYASSELYKKIEDKVPQIVKDLGVKGKIKNLDEYEVETLGFKYKQKQGEQSVSGKGFTYTQTDEQKRLEKKFGKEGGITGSVGISKSKFGDEKTIGGQINIPTDKIFRRRKRK